MSDNIEGWRKEEKEREISKKNRLDYIRDAEQQNMSTQEFSHFYYNMFLCVKACIIQKCRTIKKNKSLIRSPSANLHNCTLLCSRIWYGHNRLYVRACACVHIYIYENLCSLNETCFVFTFLLLLPPKILPFAMPYLYIPKHYMTCGLLLEYTYPGKSTLNSIIFHPTQFDN